MNSIDLSNASSTQIPEASSWIHLKLERRSAAYWRVTFDHPPINTITATTVTELSELVELIERDTQLNVIVFDSANPDFFLAHYDTENDPRKTTALPPVASSCSPATCVSPRVRTRCWDNSRSAPVSSRVAGRWPGSPGWLAAAARWRSSSSPTTSTGRERSSTATSTEPWPTTSSTRKSKRSRHDSRGSTTKRSRVRSSTSTR